MATPFVGRNEERTLVDEALGAAAASKGGAIFLSGEPGIGKSRLVEEATLGAKSRGFAVALGQSWEAEGTPAYWPWLEALRALGEDARLAEVIEEASSESPELSALLGRSAASAADPSARFRLFDAVARLLQQVAVEQPLVLVLEDLHAADSATLELALFVMRSVKRVPLLLLCTSRDASFARSSEIAALLEKAAREATLVPVRRLTRAEVTEWVGAAMPSRDVERIYEASEGNPLFVKELLASTRAASSDVPLGIRGAIRAHLALLPEPARELLEIASVLGREAPIDVLYKLAGNIDALDDAVATSIVSRSAERVRFAHVLLRDEIYGRMAPSRRVELHARAATVLKDRPAVAAHHVLQGRLPDSSLACTIIESAMAEAVSRFATADAAALGESALAVLSLPAREQARLRIAVGEALLLGGSREPGKESCRKAADLAASIEDPELLARAALTYATELLLGRHEDTVAILRRALAALPEGDSPLRARILARLGPSMIPATPEEGDAPRRFCRDAIAMARRVGDDATLFTTLRAATTTFPEDFELRERFALNTESIALAKRLGRIPHIVGMLPWQVACWLELGNMNGALEEAAAAESLLSPLPAYYQWRMLLVRATLAALDRRFAESDAIGRKVLRLAQEHDLREALVHFCIHRMSLPYLRGDAQGFEEFDALATTTLSHMHMAAVFVSLADAVMGRVDRARKGIELARSVDLRGMPGAAQLGWTVIWANLGEHAEFFYEIARNVAERSPLLFGPGALFTFGPNDLIAGQLASMMGRKADAMAHYERGLVFAKQLGAGAFIDQMERAILKETAVAAPKPSAAPGAALAMERRGEMWSLVTGPRAILVKDAKGFAYLETLVQAPHREVHVLELVGAEDDGDAGPMLDERAKREYRRRAQELRAELEEATRHNDLGRAERAREELDALAGELSRAVGVGGKDRRAASMSERARINVQRRLKDAIRRVVEQDEQLGRHLELSVKTGAFCMYAPTWP